MDSPVLPDRPARDPRCELASSEPETDVPDLDPRDDAPVLLPVVRDRAVLCLEERAPDFEPASSAWEELPAISSAPMFLTLLTKVMAAA